MCQFRLRSLSNRLRVDGRRWGGIRNDFSHQYVKKYERISSEYGSGQAAIARNAIVESNQQIY